MGKIHAIISDEVEERLRSITRRKGDISKFVEEAIVLKLDLDKDAFRRETK
jgi:hypothetical protein